MLDTRAPTQLIAGADANRASIIEFISRRETEIRGCRKIIVLRSLEVGAIFQSSPEGFCPLRVGPEVSNVLITVTPSSLQQLVLIAVKLRLRRLYISLNGSHPSCPRSRHLLA